MNKICTKCFSKQCVCLESSGITELSYRWIKDAKKAWEVTLKKQKIGEVEIPAGFNYWIPFSVGTVCPGDTIKIPNWVANKIIKNINLRKLKNVK